ncbi:MAG: cytochrome b/b6 domain-containing protein [Gemmatimonadota bacterium]|nr:cytochrome b/b6 domain-containing protein [Gemmatimonadota bacterium]
MELWRRAANPWNQDILIGVSWDLMWAAAIIGIGFVVLHAIWAQWLAPSASSGSGEGSTSAISGLPSRILRHATSERVFHWLMSAAMLVLLVTAFFPVIGIQFAWVTIHWIAGLVLTATIIYHVIHAIFWQDFWAMWIDKIDVKAGVAELQHMLKKEAAEAPTAGKYPIDHKLFHHAAAVAGLVAIVTGILMMLRLETPFWSANPYLLGDSSWGVVYVLHGLSGVGLISLVISHIYFAIRPDKWWVTKSMIYGWIGQEQYLENFDPNRWTVDRTDQPEVPVGAAFSSGSVIEGDGPPTESGTAT